MSPHFPELPRHIHLAKVRRLAGMVAENIPKGAQIEGFLYSDQSAFYKAIDQLCNIYLPGLMIDQVSTFLVVHHVDESVDVHINNMTTTMELLAKKDLKAGQGVGLADIADVRRLAFPEIAIAHDDNIVFCFKRGWKFGLYYNFRQTDGSAGLEVDALQLTLGSCYKYLTFQEEYSILQQEDLFQDMVSDGWFPLVV